MKTAITHHINAIKIVFEQLSKGNFLIYFVPGLIIMFFYLVITSLLAVFIGDSVRSVDANWFHLFMLKIGSVVDFVLAQLYIFFILTILSPINTILSEKLDSKLTGQKFSFSFIRLFNDLVRMILIVIVSILLQLVFIGIWWLFCWIIGLDDVVYTIVSFIISAFFFGFSFYDHSFERYEISVGGSINFAFSNFLLVTLTGVIFKLLYYFPYFWEVPYIGIVIAPVLTTMISTVVYLSVKNKDKEIDKNGQII